MARTSQPKTPKRTPDRGGQTLRGRMAKIRKELNVLGVSDGKDDLFVSTLDHLDALASEIAGATDQMMTAGEKIQKAALALSAKAKDRGTKTQLNRITEGTGDLFEACSFQDITGQRLGKISRTVGAIEAGVQSVSALAQGKGVKKGSSKGKALGIDRIDGGMTLEGPQVGGPQVSQSEIDKLFG
ncbi:MAG: hypothetical protein HQ512_13155 [Rhodospirillales bacterium]|nr:hypothetical protein [Rhodospirillales bacterium]